MATQIEAPKPEGLWGKFKSRINNRFITPFLNKALRGGDNYKYWDNVSQLVDVTYPAGFEKTVQEADRQGYAFLIYHTHRSHPDIFSLQKVIQKTLSLAPSLEGVSVPIATTIETGHQGEDLKDHFSGKDLGEWLHARGAHWVNVVRKKDETEHGVKRSARGTLKLFTTLPGHNWALAEFPEASTTPGKENEDGIPKGMVDFNDERLMYFFTREQVSAGKKVLYIPVASVGSERIFNPDIKKTRWQAKAVYQINRLIRLLNPDYQIKLIHTVVGQPFSSDQLLEKTGGNMKVDAIYEVMHDKLGSSNPKVLPPRHNLYKLLKEEPPREPNSLFSYIASTVPLLDKEISISNGDLSATGLDLEELIKQEEVQNH